MSAGASIAHVHQDYSSDWWTPPNIWEWVRQTLGTPVYDPCPAGYDPDEDASGLDATWDPELPTYMNYPGGINAARMWYRKALLEHGHAHHVGEPGRKGLSRPLIICFFNNEHTRGLDPWIDHLPGWLIKPRDRTRFIWGGPTLYYPADHARHGEVKRERGLAAKSPTDWAWWWTSTAPAPFPGDHVVVGTGGFS